MITVIMPSMFIPEGIVEMVKKVCEHPLVGEFILMDNTVNGGNIKEEIPKLIYIEEGKNTFINPAWNKGVLMAKYDKLMFLNDDVVTDFELIDKVYDLITEDRGMIGLGEGCWDYRGGEFNVRPIQKFRGGFACLFFMHKNSYYHIPEDLKVWYGDNWLFEKSDKQPYEIVNWKMGGKISATINTNTIWPITKEDETVWNKKYKNTDAIFFPMRKGNDQKEGLKSLIQHIQQHSDTKKLRMIEIGSYIGESTMLFCDNFMEVISIDPHMDNYDLDDPACDRATFNVVNDKFNKNMSKYVNFNHIRMTSDDAIKHLIGVKVDFIYIDGLHTYEQVKKDIKNYLPLLTENGFIGGHDYGDNWPGVIKAVNESLSSSPDNVFVDTSWIKKI